MMKIKINNQEITALEGQTVLQAALQAGIYIPNLCYHPDLPPIGACRLCVVEISGRRGFPTACTTKVQEGMEVSIDTPELKNLRQNLIWLTLSELPKDLDEATQLKKVVDYIGVKDLLPGYVYHPKDLPILKDEPLFIRDLNKCILCGRCVKICQEVRGVGTIGFINRGIKTVIGTGGDLPLKNAGCKFCTACVEVCPSGALVDKEKYEAAEREKFILPCANTCPAGIDIPRYVELIAQGRSQDSLEVIRERVPFPHVLGCVCDRPCEAVCKRDEINQPVAIRELKRFVAEKDTGRWIPKVTIAPESGKKVAIVGAGPAGLTAGWYLRKLGHQITVFDALPEPGGMTRIGIPAYRLPRDILKQEIKYIQDIGVTIKTNTRVASLDKLFEQGYNAVFLALGAPEGMGLGIPGEDHPGVLDGISVLQEVNLGGKGDVTGKVAVVGGGNVAIDVARSSLRVGAEEVTILYRRTREEMPAYEEEIEEALKEGVKIDFLVAPKQILPDREKLKLECLKMELGEPDASGRRRPVPIQGSEFILEIDRLIAAIGQKTVVPEAFGVKTDRKGRIQADSETLATTRAGVFAGGDVVSGPFSVIEAIQAGRKAAAAIDKYLGGKGLIDQKYIPDEKADERLGREEGFADRTREEVTLLPVEKRLSGFPLVEFGLDEKASLKESERCLQCQLRLQISPPPLPPAEPKKA